MGVAQGEQPLPLRVVARGKVSPPTYYHVMPTQCVTSVQTDFPSIENESNESGWKDGQKQPLSLAWAEQDEGVGGLGLSTIT